MLTTTHLSIIAISDLPSEMNMHFCTFAFHITREYLLHQAQSGWEVGWLVFLSKWEVKQKNVALTDIEASVTGTEYGRFHQIHQNHKFDYVKGEAESSWPNPPDSTVFKSHPGQRITPFIALCPRHRMSYNWVQTGKYILYFCKI